MISLSAVPLSPPNPTLAALRQAVRVIEGEGRAFGVVGLGEGALDALLPERGLRRGAVHEIAPAVHFEGPSALAFALGLCARALAGQAGAMAWILPRRCEFGRPYGPGLAGFGLHPQRLLLVEPRRREEALWATEEAVRAGLACVLAELGEEAADLVAARRLQLAAEQAGAFLLLLRPPGLAPAISARTRWRVAGACSAPPDWSRREALPAPGAVRLRLHLERARAVLLRGTLEMDVEWRHASGAFHLAAPLAERAAALELSARQSRRVG